METFVDEALHWIFFLAIGMVEGDWLHRKKGSCGSCSHLYTEHRHQDRDFIGQHMQTFTPIAIQTTPIAIKSTSSCQTHYVTMQLSVLVSVIRVRRA